MMNPTERRGSAAESILLRTVPASHSLMAVALTLPGMAASLAHAESAPEKGVVGVKYLSYEDKQPDNTATNNEYGNGIRTRVTSPSFYLLAPIGSQWSVETSGVADTVTGPTPYYHSTLSKNSEGQRDYRKALDTKITRYFDKMTLGIGGAYSEEHDYTSRALSADGRFYFDNNNTVLAVGAGISSDLIRAGGQLAVIQALLPPSLPPLFAPTSRHTHDYLLGVTRVLTPSDVLQSNVTYALGNGYYGEQYKNFYSGNDIRPSTKYQLAWLTRWNHYFAGLDAALHLSYRFYHDSFGIRSHTLGAEWYQPVGFGITVVPELRAYTQHQAYFYSDDSPFGTTVNIQKAADGGFMSFDQRLSSYGAYTYGLKVIWDLPKDYTIDLKGEKYEARGSWRWDGTGSQANLPFTATFVQVGLSKKF